ncbi:glycine/D-amino acid oxidase-like deaminating enzyme [Pseudomonas duriflava]|uniref:Glycine/D-amino acid oxidase-like deaminating enzyme n=1 Tax=Pseudomonas duriflava TaxID=459528 RepID=A0A562QFQ2_9PSED|nr:FAD-binding oxidoreductase [Pseudomonas duriflava]TWI55578.1 glycine/D-amino acid oxidase-like deaminating enzyme [Pseudomonas duriflava]
MIRFNSGMAFASFNSFCNGAVGMGPQVDPVETDTKHPEQTSVVIIGGGIAGTSAALWLARQGIPTILCEKGHIAGEQSSRNWGWVRKLYRDPREIPLAVEALRLWEGLNEIVEAETGFRRSGILFSAESEAEALDYERWIALARPQNVDVYMVAGRELDALLPSGQTAWKSGIYCPTDGRAEPQKAAPAIARAAQRAGAIILTGCAVRGLERSAGRISAVVTERGRIACEAVVLAGGAWSSRFLKDLGVRLPQLKVRNSVLRTAPLEGGPDCTLWTQQAAFRKRLDGGYTIANGSVNIASLVPDSFRFFMDFLPTLKTEWSSLRLRLDERFRQEWEEGKTVPLDQVSPYERMRVLDPEPDLKQSQAALNELIRQFPVFSQAHIVQHWAGLIDVTPDAVPVISPIDSVPGLIVATGLSGHGFGVGPAVGQLAADLVTGAPPIVDPYAFRFSRFTDGSKPRPMKL